MLTVHKIKLLAGVSVAQKSVLRREDVANLILSEEIIDAAHLRARETIKHAQLAAEQVRQQAYEEVSRALWEQAQALLDDWEKEREEMRERNIEHVKQLLVQALHLAFAQEPTHARIEILLNQLQQHHNADNTAVLMVNPQQYEQVEQFLKAQGNRHWTVVNDAHQATDELCLKSRHGKYTLSWPRLTDRFVSTIEGHSHPVNVAAGAEKPSSR